MKKILLVFTFVLIAALALSACEPADDAALSDAERTATAEAGIVDPTAQVEPDLDLTETVPGEEEPIVPPPAPDAEVTPTMDAAGQPVTSVPDDTGAVEDVVRAEIYRLSNVIDWNVRDQQGEEVGSVNSFVVDQESGYIHYVLVEPAGDLEVDGEVIAVPWNALTVSHLDAVMETPMTETEAVTSEDGAVEETPVGQEAVAAVDEDPHFILAVDSQVLANAPVIEGLEEVDFASPQWQNAFTGYWEGQLAGLPVTGEMESDAELQTPLRLDDVTGYDIYNFEDEQIADVAEMIVDPETGQITHIVAGVGGFLGLGESYVPILFQSFDYDEGEEFFILETTQEELENAPSVQAMSELRFTEPNWTVEYDQYWGVENGEQPLETEQEQVATPTP